MFFNHKCSSCTASVSMTSRSTKSRWKGHVRRRKKYWPSVYKVNVQRLNQATFTKKGNTTKLDNFVVVKENEMEFGTTSACVTHNLSNAIT